MSKTNIKFKPKEIIVACPCGKKLFKIKNPKENFTFTCKCGHELILKRVNNTLWELVPADNIWIID